MVVMKADEKLVGAVLLSLDRIFALDHEDGAEIRHGGIVHRVEYPDGLAFQPLGDPP